MNLKLTILVLLCTLSWQSANAQPITLVTLGDSLTAGDGDENGGFPPRLLQLLQTPYPNSSLNNLAVSGLTSNDLINIELTPAINHLNLAPESNLKIALIWIGSNDLFGLYNNVCDEYFPGDYPSCEAEELNSYKNNIDKILSALKATGAKLYIALLDDQSKRPVMTDANLRHEAYVAITPEEIQRMSTQVRTYNDAIKSIATQHEVTLVDFYNTDIFTDWDSLSSDGNHPNSSGYDFIANQWYAAITNSTIQPINIDPILDIKLAQTVTVNNPVTISLGLNSGSHNDQNADWWLVVITPSEAMQSYIHPNQWIDTITFENMPSAYQGPLFDFDPISLTNYTGTEVGNYQFYFGVDLLANNHLDMSALFYTGANLQVQSAQPSGNSDSTPLNANDFQYLGAFRLPDGGERPKTFAYGGDAITYNPDGNASNGSLFVMGHDRLPYGEMPDGNQVAEINIPVPIISKNLDELNQAEFIQDFQDIAKGYFSTLEEMPTAGMQYLSTPKTGAKIHLCWGQHNQDSAETMTASHAWFDPDLSAANLQGPWFVGDEFSMSTNAFLFDIPTDWANQHLAGRYLASGRFRDGGWGGQGPSLVAYKPWTDNTGTPAAVNSHLNKLVLLQYISSFESDDVVAQSLTGYQHPDEWEGGAWITTDSGKSALLFAGTKATGDKYWYGYIDADNPAKPCIDIEVNRTNDFTICRMADGTTCPAEDLNGCSAKITHRGWWSSHFDAQFILYNPDDLARVATGQMEPWQPQPYASIDIDEHFLLKPNSVDREMLGIGEQRRYRVGEITYDRIYKRLFVLELFADDSKPVVHVWKIRG